MWKQVWEHFRLVITLTERVARHDDDIRDVGPLDRLAPPSQRLPGPMSRRG